jgi:uncharacterized protein YjbI with pentapeptide repeats
MAQSQADRKQAQIDRINQISDLARTAWFSLLFYLVFVGVTLLAVEDADFFIPLQRTQLPLIGVEIPTASFFWIAPTLGAALYTYLHLFLIKLWDAHQPPTHDEDPTHHWLVNDFVLIRQRDPVARARPLAWLTVLITRLLVWVAGPLVLAYAWWRSMPAHNEWMTLFIAACLGAALFVGMTTWWRAEARLRFRRTPGGWYKWTAAGLCALLLLAVSWLRTEGDFDYSVSEAWGLLMAVRPPAAAPDEGTGTTAATAFRRLNEWLAPIDLEGVEFVELPSDWRPLESARVEFREIWCRREGLAMAVCGEALSAGTELPPTVAAARRQWCAELDGVAADSCAAYFSSLDARFEVDWVEERRAAIASLPKPSLARSDLRFAHAGGAVLVNADLSAARLEAAELFDAWLEGADLARAQLQNADLEGARLQAANLNWASLEGAILLDAHLEGVHLMWAKLNGAQLTRARLAGADLRWARLEGADLTGAQLEGTDLRYADFRESSWAGASNRASLAQFADLRGARGLTQAQLESLIGNKGTLLPEGPAPDTGQPYYVWSCWETPPSDLDRIVSTASGTDVADRAALRAEFLCGHDNPHRKTGTPGPLDSPDRPLADHVNED